MATLSPGAGAGSPVKVLSPGAGKPQLGFEDLSGSGFELDPDEGLITHQRLDPETRILAELGCGQEVLMVEGLLVLEGYFNVYLESFQGIRMYEEDLRLLNHLAGSGSVERFKRAWALIQKLRAGTVKGNELSRDDQMLVSNFGDSEMRMSKFARALILAGSCTAGVEDDIELQLRAAATGTGVTVLMLVLKAVQDDFPGNQALEYLKENPRVAIASWADVEERRTHRNASSHLFAMIGPEGVATASKAVTVMEGLSVKYPQLQMLIDASLPLIRQKIRQHMSVRRVESQDSIFKSLGV